MNYQFAVGREHISSLVKVLQPLRVFTDCGSQMESKCVVGGEVVESEGRGRG